MTQTTSAVGNNVLPVNGERKNGRTGSGEGEDVFDRILSKAGAADAKGARADGTDRDASGDAAGEEVQTGEGEATAPRVVEGHAKHSDGGQMPQLETRPKGPEEAAQEPKAPGSVKTPKDAAPDHWEQLIGAGRERAGQGGDPVRNSEGTPDIGKARNAEDLVTEVEVEGKADAIPTAVAAASVAASATVQRSPLETLRNLSAALTFGPAPAKAQTGEVSTQQGGDTPANAESGDDLFRFAAASNTDPDALPALASGERLRAALERTVEAEKAGNANVEPEFSVIETRKFLGVAAGQTAVASIVSSITENEQWNSMLREASATAATTLNAARNAASSLRIQLNPVELGMVTATLKMSGGNLSIELKVETMEAYRQLGSDQNGLVKALRGQGYDVDQIVLHPPSTADRAAGAQAPQPAMAGQAANGAAQQGGGAGAQAEAGAGQGRQQQDGRGDGGAYGRGEQGRDGQDSNRDPRRPGGVYL